MSLDYEGETVKGAPATSGRWQIAGTAAAGVLVSWHALPCSPRPTSPPPSTPAELRIRYYDTIPPCSALCLMRKGFLFAASELGDHGLYMLSVRCGTRGVSRCLLLLAAAAMPHHVRWQLCWQLCCWGWGLPPFQPPTLSTRHPPVCTPLPSQSLGEDDDTVESSSAALMETEEGFQPVFFDPRPLTNLELLDRLDRWGAGLGGLGQQG